MKVAFFHAVRVSLALLLGVRCSVNMDLQVLCHKCVYDPFENVIGKLPVVRPDTEEGDCSLPAPSECRF